MSEVSNIWSHIIWPVELLEGQEFGGGVSEVRGGCVNPFISLPLQLTPPDPDPNCMEPCGPDVAQNAKPVKFKAKTQPALPVCSLQENTCTVVPTGVPSLTLMQTKSICLISFQMTKR